MNEPSFNVAALKRCVRSEGPYKRLAIWFQGCNICCNGCCNPDLIPLIMKHKIKLSVMLDIIRSSKKEFDIEGITLLGGEPTLQNGLPILCKRVREMGLGVILFTGNLFDDLAPDIKNNVDLVIDGKYEKNLPDSERNMIGSSNQRIIDVTGRYEHILYWFTDKRGKYVEISLEDGELEINGDYLPLDIQN